MTTLFLNNVSLTRQGLIWISFDLQHPLEILVLTKNGQSQPIVMTSAHHISPQPNFVLSGESFFIISSEATDDVRTSAFVVEGQARQFLARHQRLFSLEIRPTDWCWYIHQCLFPYITKIHIYVPTWTWTSSAITQYTVYKSAFAIIYRVQCIRLESVCKQTHVRLSHLSIQQNARLHSVSQVFLT